ncbi:unnamed protein product [Gordionus sp. m RMFG-2023]
MNTNILSNSTVLPNNLVDLTLVGVWNVSSYKIDHGVKNLKDNNLETFWQSSGPQPHFIDISYPYRVSISKIYIYIDYKLDESYSPNK